MTINKYCWKCGKKLIKEITYKDKIEYNQETGEKIVDRTYFMTMKCPEYYTRITGGWFNIHGDNEYMSKDKKNWDLIPLRQCDF
jgi:hypothetical protein